VSIDVILQDGITLLGTVRGEDQQPLAGIVLRVEPKRGEDLRVTTDPGGAYRLEGLAPGWHRLHVESQGWYPRNRRDALLKIEVGMTHAFEPPDLVLLPARALRGRIRDASGAPVAGARVWLVSGRLDLVRPREAGGLFEAFSDSNGEWAIADIPPDARVTVRAALGAREAVPARVVWTADGPQTIDLALASTGVLRGTLVDVHTGDGIPGVTVRLEPWPRDGRTFVTARTDGGGAFLAEALIPGRWLVRPVSADHLRSPGAEVSVETGASADVSIALDPGVVLAGVCVDEEDKALPWAKLLLRGRRQDGRAVVPRRLNADADGSFHAGGLRPGVYELRVMLDGYRTTFVKEIRSGDARMRIVLKKL